jgi:DNA invertase Pin-like site-specific DNA recombinase
MTVYGYARVSTDGQALDTQTEQLRGAGAVEVSSEKVSVAKTDRQELQRLIKTLKQDDVLLVTKLDRLARSTLDLQNILASVKSVGANFKVLDNPSLDTTNIYGKLLFYYSTS